MSTAISRGVLGRVRAAAWSDEALLERAREGDSPCLDALFRRHYDAVLGFCLLRLGDRQAAEDATQEVFLRVHRASGSPVGHVKAWLFAIARNVVVDAVRREGHHQDLADISEAVESIAGATDGSEFAALGVPSNIFVALRRLSARDRKLMIMRDFQDRSSEEMAAELGMSPGAVDVAIFRARGAFGKAYTEVAEMPAACRETTEAIYRETGSGLMVASQQRMQVHIAACPRCAAEYRRSRAPRMLAPLVGAPWLAAALGSVNRVLLPQWSVPAKATLGAALAFFAVAPTAVSHAGLTPAPKFESALSAAPVGGTYDPPSKRLMQGPGSPAQGTTSAQHDPIAGDTFCEPAPMATTHDVHSGMTGGAMYAGAGSVTMHHDTGGMTGTQSSGSGSGTQSGGTMTGRGTVGPMTGGSGGSGPHSGTGTRR